MMMDDVAFIDTSFYFYFIFCNGKDSTFIKGFRRSFFCMIFSNLSHECESIMICKKLLSYLFSTILYLFFTKKPIRNSKKGNQSISLFNPPGHNFFYVSLYKAEYRQPLWHPLPLVLRIFHQC